VDEARITRLAADLTVKMDLSSLRFKADHASTWIETPRSPTFRTT